MPVFTDVIRKKIELKFLFVQIWRHVDDTLATLWRHELTKHYYYIVLYCVSNIIHNHYF